MLKIPLQVERSHLFDVESEVMDQPDIQSDVNCCEPSSPPISFFHSMIQKNLRQVSASLPTGVLSL